MSHVMKICFGVALLLVTLVPVVQADDFKLSNNQRISCSRGLSAGKLSTATCRSYAYLFNIKTTEYFRCQVSLALTRRERMAISPARPSLKRHVEAFRNVGAEAG